VLLVGATAAAVIVAETSWFKNWLRGYIVKQANQYINGQLSIARLGGNLFFGVELQNIGVSMDGSQVVAVQDLGLKYNVFDLILKGLSVDEVSLNKPVIYLRRDGDTWSIARLIKKQEQEADREGPASPIAIDRIGISDASVVIDGPVGTSGVNVPSRVDNVDAELSFKYEPVQYSIEITHVSFRAKQPSIGLNALSGGVSVKDDTVFVKKLALRTEESSIAIDGAVQHYLTAPTFNLRVSSDKLSIPEIARLVPSLSGIPLQPAFEVAVDGPLDRLGVDVNVRSSAGQLTGKFLADAAAPGVGVAGQIAVRHLDLAPLTKTPASKSDLTADAKLEVKAADPADLNTLSGTASLDVPRIALAGYAADHVSLKTQLHGRRVALDARAGAYGAAMNTSGTVTIPQGKEPVAYDLAGGVRHLDVSKLPRTLGAPPASTDVNATFRARGSEPMQQGAPRVVNAQLRFGDSTALGARLEAGSTVGVAMRGSDTRYQADATVSGVDLERVGRELNMPALADGRYESNLNAHVTASGSGTTPETMNVTASGSLTDSTILGGRIPGVDFAAAVANGTAHVTADGALADFDPSVASGRADTKGRLSGTFDVDATVDRFSKGATVDNVAATVRATLAPSKIGDLEISWANVDADYEGQRGEIRDLEVVGRDLNVSAWGPIALDQEGQSRLTFHADTPNLAMLGKLAGVQVEGIAKVDGTLTGNRSELRADGTLVGDGIQYGEDGSTGALTVSSHYHATVPELDYMRAKVDADTKATFVSIGGQEINELEAKTSYADKEVTFEATARQPKRSLTAAGALAMLPDAQQVRLQQLVLDTQGLVWSLASNTPATIDYSGDTVAVKDLALVSGAERITASGAFGRPDDQLTVKVENLDVANVDALMLRPPQFSGTMNGSVVVSGTKAAPAVKADMQIGNGGFRQFHYDTLNASAIYKDAGVTVDARLQQNASQWLAAKGYLPASLFSTTSGSPDDRIDLTIDSSPIDLGLIQGFTTQLSKVTGTLEAHVKVGGTAADPQPSGALTVQNGTIKVEPTGVGYNHIAARVDLLPDRVHVDQITVLDDNDNALSVTGDLAVKGKQVGGVQVYVNASDFKILDNKIGDVHVGTSLELSGDLSAPRVAGDISVNQGKIDLDQAIALAGMSPYATKETQYQTAEKGTAPTQPGAAGPQASGAASSPASGLASAPASGAASSPGSSLSLDVGVSVPNDFIVKADNLQSPGAPIGLGSLNLTLGGDLHASLKPGDTLRLRGSVNTVRGFYDFQGRRFDILRDGTVRFEGLDQIDPALDIRAQRIIQGVTALVNVRGTLYKPQIVLSSTPPLEQADILSLIVFNQPLNQMSESQQISLAARAESMAAGAVTSQLAQSIGNALNLDQFEVNLAPETGGGPQVTLGQQVGQNLYVRVQQGVGEQTSTNLILEYDLTQWLRLQTNVIQGASTEQSLFRRAQSSGADLIFVFSY
jgi:autotransporter translocation and assembly factor TamB